MSEAHGQSCRRFLAHGLWLLVAVGAFGCAPAMHGEPQAPEPMVAAAVPVPDLYQPFAREGSLALLYSFDGATPGSEPNLATPGTGNLVMVGQSAYGSWRGDEVWPDDHGIYPYRVMGRGGFLSALRTGTAVDAVGPTAWLPRFEDGYTICAWVRVDDQGDEFGGTVLNLGYGYKQGWRLDFTKAQWAMEGQVSLVCGTAEGSTNVSTKPFQLDTWHLVTLVATQGTMQLYVDGALAGTTTEPLNMPTPPAPGPAGEWLDARSAGDGVRIAAKWYSKARALDYRLDEFVGLRRSLSAAEIRELYLAGKPGDAGNAEDLGKAERLAREAAREAELNALTLAIPTSSWGYFPAEEPITLQFCAPAGDIAPHHASYSLRDATGTELAQERLAFPATLPATLSATVTIAKPGLYLLSMRIADAEDRMLNERSYPLGITVAAIPASTSTPTAPLPWLGAQNLAYHPEPLAIGAGLNRVVCEWSRLEPLRGEYDWTALDFMVHDPRNRELDLLVCLTGFPGWLGARRGELLDARAADAYASIWRKLVARYPQVQSWEVWDAPNRPAARGALAIAPYRQLLAIAAPEIRRAPGDRRVVGGGAWDGDVAWSTAVLKDDGGAGLDVLSIHTHLAEPARDGGLDDGIAALRASCAADGYPTLPVWNTSLGVLQPARQGRFPESPEAAVTPPDTRPVPLLAERAAATAMVQSLLLQRAAGVERVVIEPGIAAYHPRANNSDGNPSWKGLALATLRQALGRRPTLQRLDSAAPGLCLFSFLEDDGQTGLIAFTSTAAGTATLRVLPTTAGKPLRVLDMIGTPLAPLSPLPPATPIGAQDTPIGVEPLTFTVGAEPAYFFNATIHPPVH